MKFLFLSPYGVIDDWRFFELQLQEILSLNNEIHIIGCRGTLKKSCIAIKAHSNFYKKNYLKEKICKRCVKNQHDYKKNYKIFYIEDYINKSDKLLLNVELSKININNFTDYRFEDLEIGKISLFENLLIFKKNDLKFTLSEFEIIKNTIFDTLLFYLAIKKIYKISNPDIGISQNGSYSLSKLFNNFLIQKKKKSYAWDASQSYHERFNKMNLKKYDNNYGINYIKSNWFTKFRHRPLTKNNIKAVNKHIEAVISAKSLRKFSKKYNHTDKSLRDIYNISEKKILLLSTSSWDEIVGTYLAKDADLSDLLIFKSQKYWLEQCIDFFKDKKDCRLIIRPHPRDFSSKYSEISNFIKDNPVLPDNITFNLPSHNVSLYNILKDVDLVLNAWSSLALEAGILNVPVISISDELTVHPPELEYYQKNEKDYFLKINLILNQNNNQFDLNRCKNFYNFLTSYMVDNDINLQLQKNDIFYSLFKILNKITFFLSTKSYFKNFLGYNKNIKETNTLLNIFFNNNSNVFNEVEKNSIKNDHAKDQDYMNGFLELSKMLINKKENSIYFDKTIELKNKIIPRK